MFSAISVAYPAPPGTVSMSTISAEPWRTPPTTEPSMLSRAMASSCDPLQHGVHDRPCRCRSVVLRSAWPGSAEVEAHDISSRIGARATSSQSFRYMASAMNIGVSFGASTRPATPAPHHSQMRYPRSLAPRFSSHHSRALLDDAFESPPGNSTFRSKRSSPGSAILGLTRQLVRGGASPGSSASASLMKPNRGSIYLRRHPWARIRTPGSRRAPRIE